MSPSHIRYQSNLQEKSSLLIVIWSTEQDEREAIDKSNILKGDRTRHAKPTGTYQEPSDEQGLPKTVLDGTDGISSTRWVESLDRKALEEQIIRGDLWNLEWETQRISNR